MIDNTLKELIISKIKAKSGIDFQHFFQEVMKIKHGDLIDTLADSSDLGADCILKREDGNIEKIYAVYAPESNKYTLSQLKSKYSGDYDSFKENWDHNVIEWVPVCNRKYTGEAYQYLQTLAAPTELYDIDKIMELILTLNYTQLDRLCKYLNIDPGFLIYNIIDIIISDIISQDTDSVDNDFDNLPPELLDKIKENFEEAYRDLQIQYFRDQYYEKITYFKDYFEKLESNNQNIIKSIFHNAYMRNIQIPNFQNILENIINLLGQNHLNDSYYMYWLRIITYYMFEICVIGKEPKK